MMSDLDELIGVRIETDWRQEDPFILTPCMVTDGVYRISKSDLIQLSLTRGSQTTPDAGDTVMIAERFRRGVWYFRRMTVDPRWPPDTSTTPDRRVVVVSRSGQVRA